MCSGGLPSLHASHSVPLTASRVLPGDVDEQLALAAIKGSAPTAGDCNGVAAVDKDHCVGDGVAAPVGLDAIATVDHPRAGGGSKRLVSGGGGGRQLLTPKPRRAGISREGFRARVGSNHRALTGR